MARKSLWGKLPEVPEERLPIEIMKEQASEISTLTNYKLSGKVRARAYEGELNVDLDIVVPLMNDYSVTIARVEHGVQGYPARLTSPVSGGVYAWTCNDAADFEGALGKILQSEQILQIVSSLLAQAKAL